uniref:Uncharacterized protein n=1 Tax=Lotharella oceanica TaxID=641309 RepID=A0A7S2XG82_9EUKA|mmetsp:Transcript_32798/g.60986  ORF Transcript_32798/g.60986 Transcript_32798/m.60986 type:complete len:150 (+) Transcript_32798:315-764(+)
MTETSMETGAATAVGYQGAENHHGHDNQQRTGQNTRSSPASSSASARASAPPDSKNAEENASTAGLDDEKSRQNWLLDQMKQTWDHLTPAEKRRAGNFWKRKGIAFKDLHLPEIAPRPTSSPVRRRGWAAPNQCGDPWGYDKWDAIDTD